MVLKIIRVPSGFICIIQVNTYHRVNLIDCAKDLGVQLVFSI